MTKDKNVNTAADFAADMLAEGTVSVPVILLKNYYRMGLSDGQLLLLLHIQYYINKSREIPDTDKLAEYCGKTAIQISEMLQSLQQDGFLEERDVYQAGNDTVCQQYSLAPLYDKISELWAQKRIEDTKKIDQIKALQSEIQKKIFTPELSRLVVCFENEFGRPLTPIEFEQVGIWLDKGYSEELIKEALRQSVLRGVYKLKYVDGILLDWENNNIHTVQQARQEEQEFRRRRGNENHNEKSDKRRNSKDKQLTPEEKKRKELIRSLYEN